MDGLNPLERSTRSITYVYRRKPSILPSSSGTSAAAAATSAKSKYLFATEPVLLAEIAPDPTLKEHHMQALVQETEIQNVPTYSIAATNTDRLDARQRGMRHTEGGWPNNVDVEDVESRAKHLRRLEREEGYLQEMQALFRKANPFLRLNAALDIFETYDDFSEGKKKSKRFAHHQESGSSIKGGAASSQGVGHERGEISVSEEHVAGGSLAPVSGNSPQESLLAGAPPPPLPDNANSMSTGRSPTTDGTHGGGFPTAGGASSSAGGAPSAAKSLLTHALNSAHPPHSLADGATTPTMRVMFKYVAPRQGALVSQLAFGHTNHTSRLVAGYRHQDPQERLAAAVWSTASEAAPTHLLCSPVVGGLTAITCSVKDEYHVAGGTSCGILQLWDLRQSSSSSSAAVEGMLSPVASSKRIVSHNHVVTAVKYVHANGVDLMSTALDGTVLFWDLRNFSTPIIEESLDLRMSIHDEKHVVGGTQEQRSPCSLDFDAMLGSQHYLVGTLEGSVIACSRRGGRPRDRILNIYDVSVGSVHSVQRCPAVPKCFLAVSGWSWQIYGDEVISPLVQCAAREEQMTAGRWHPTRSSWLLTGTSTGRVELWNLLQNSKRPVVTATIAMTPITQCLPHVRGSQLACADSEGNTYLLALDDGNGCHPSIMERQLMSAMLEREYLRERAQSTTALSALGIPPLEDADDDRHYDGENGVFGYIEELDADMLQLEQDYLQATAFDETSVNQQQQPSQQQHSSSSASPSGGRGNNNPSTIPPHPFQEEQESGRAWSTSPLKHQTTTVAEQREGSTALAAAADSWNVRSGSTSAPAVQQDGSAAVHGPDPQQDLTSPVHSLPSRKLSLSRTGMKL